MVDQLLSAFGDKMIINSYRYVSGVDLTENLITWHTMDETSGNRLDSVVGTGNDLGNFTMSSTTGIVGNAATSVGSAGLLSLSNPTNIHANSRDFMQSVWVYPVTSMTTLKSLIGVGTNALPDYYLVFFANKIRLYYYDGSSLLFLDSTSTITADAWHHIVWWFNFSASTIDLVVDNGTASQATSVTNIADSGNSADLDVNRARGWGVNALGTVHVDENGFWDKIPDAAMISALYNGGSGVGYPG